MYRDVAAEKLTRAQFDAARLGFLQLLRRKRMSPQFIERHGEDLFAQACFEYSRQLAEGKAIGNPVAWIITCGWHRTVGLLEARDWRPRVVSTERVGELGDEAEAPEGAFLAAERHRKVREAVEHLPAYQRRLLALSYFEGESVREAARRLDWTPSKGQRAHEAARRRLHKLLGVQSSDELAIEVGLAAFLSLSGGERAMHLRLIGGVEGVIDSLAHHTAQAAARALDLLRRPFHHGAAAAPGGRVEAAGELGRAVAGEGHGPIAAALRGGRRLSEAGRRLVASGGLEASGAAAEGGGRAVEVCKAAIAVCLVSGSAVTGVLLGSSQQHPGAHHRAASRTAQHSRPAHTVAADSAGLAAGGGAPDAAESAVAASGSDPSANPATANTPSPAARRAQRHREEEASAEGQFSAFAKAAASESEGSRGANSAAYASSAESGSTAATTEAEAEPSSATSAEEREVHHQFREGLP